MNTTTNSCCKTHVAELPSSSGHIKTNLFNPVALPTKAVFLPPSCSSKQPHSNNKNSTSIRKYTSVVVLSKKGTGTEGHADDEEGLTYKDSGVDIDAGAELLSVFNPSPTLEIDTSQQELVRRIAKRAPGIGGFSGLVPLGDLYLVAGMDGVGTKLKLAFESGMHETIGIDLVAMSVNDIVTSGAKPLCFLDYYATSRLDVDLAEKETFLEERKKKVASSILNLTDPKYAFLRGTEEKWHLQPKVKKQFAKKVIIGIKNGCQQCGCELLGGETAEMPDFYAQGEYDLSGCAIGTVKKDSLIDGKNIKVGDVLIGLPSSGLHSNGFSLVRRVLERSGCSLKDNLPGTNITLSESLLTPTIIYVKQVLDIISKDGVKGISHITGGGFTEIIPRMFPTGLGALIFNDSWVVPPVFKWIQEAERIEYVEMRRTFNMGIGMVLVVSKESASKILAEANGQNVAYHIGEVVSGHGVIYQ
ncbi:Phosphoribosylformylglycinamidine cyclo-ligase, chloroplastic [Orobanche gracilis]